MSRLFFIICALALAVTCQAAGQLTPIRPGSGSGTVSQLLSNLTSNPYTGYTNAPGSSTNATGTAFTNIVAGRTVHVMTNGNDSTALADDLTKPALTFNKAIDLASAGYTVVGWPGTFLQSSNLWRKSGVNFHLFNGCVVVMTNISTDRGWGIFDDRFSDMAVTSNVTGDGRFLWCSGLPTVDDGVWSYVNAAAIGLHVQTNPLTRTRISGLRADCAGFSTVPGLPSGSYCAAGTNSFHMAEGIFDLYQASNHVDFDETLGGPESIASELTGNYWGVGEQHISGAFIGGRRYALYGQDDGSGGQFLQNWHANFTTILGKVYLLGLTNYNWKLWLRFNELVNTNFGVAESVGIDLYNPGSYYVQDFGRIFSQHGFGIGTVGSGRSWFTGQKVLGKTGWASLAGGFNVISIQHFEDGGSVTDGFTLSGGTNYIGGLEATVTNTAGRVVLHTGGRTTINGMRLSTSGNTNCVVLVRTNNLTLQNTALVGASTQFSVSTDLDATQHVRFMGVFATTESTNKCTNAIGPFTVSGFVQ